MTEPDRQRSMLKWILPQLYSRYPCLGAKIAHYFLLEEDVDQGFETCKYFCMNSTENDTWMDWRVPGTDLGVLKVAELFHHRKAANLLAIEQFQRSDIVSRILPIEIGRVKVDDEDRVTQAWRISNRKYSPRGAVPDTGTQQQLFRGAPFPQRPVDSWDVWVRSRQFCAVFRGGAYLGPTKLTSRRTLDPLVCQEEQRHHFGF